MIRRNDDTAHPDRHMKPGRQKGGAVIDARISTIMVRNVGAAIERQPVRAAEVLRAWMGQRH